MGVLQSGGARGALWRAALRAPPPLPKGKEPKQDSYLGDMDLPSSSEESEGEERYTPLYAAEDKDRELNSMVCLYVLPGQHACLPCVPRPIAL